MALTVWRDGELDYWSVLTMWPFYPQHRISAALVSPRRNGAQVESGFPPVENRDRWGSHFVILPTVASPGHLW
jgi:hypothetical protein